MSEKFKNLIKVTRYTFLQEVWALGATLTTRVCSRKSITRYIIIIRVTYF